MGSTTGGARRIGAMGFASAPQLTHFLRMQNMILSETEKLSSNWFKRRQDAVRIILRSGADFTPTAIGDPAKMIRMITDFQAASSQWLAKDIHDCADMMTRCASGMLQQEAGAKRDIGNKTRPLKIAA